jgi:4-diphosphocytidyl-2-C-methyl-D-erythritol kinase
MPEVVRAAPAKVNLALSVGPAEAPTLGGGSPNPRAGWHPIASWMVCLDLHDTVRISPRAAPTAPRITWEGGRPVEWPPEKDLAVRAHRALEARTGRALPCELTVEKRTPAGGGLGGGSSDAAATLLALREAFGLPFGEDDLSAVAATLGSDVPFFLDPAHRPALVFGFGESTRRLPYHPGRVTLVIPPFGCSTPDVYRAFDHLPPSGGPDLARVLRTAGGTPADWFNDLEPAAEAVEPGLAAIRRAAAQVAGSRAMVTGSGSTVVVAGDHASALSRAAKEHLWSAGPLAGCRVVPATFLEGPACGS